MKCRIPRHIVLHTSLVPCMPVSHVTYMCSLPNYPQILMPRMSFKPIFIAIFQMRAGALCKPIDIEHVDSSARVDFSLSISLMELKSPSQA